MKAASLNHVYRLVWSKLQHAWVAVAETCRAQGKSSVSGHIVASSAASESHQKVALTASGKWGFVLASAFAAAMSPFNSFADTNVVAGVIAGDLTVNDISATHTQYVHTANVNIVDFYKFGVMKDHQLDVVMPDAGRALYRVIGNSRSEIMGTLNSNGSLFLINQNGVLFGQGSEVNVGNIVASSLNISNDDFLQGRYQFNAANQFGTVENRGVIKAQNEGYIVMLGNTVDNSGTLVASNGSVVLGSAQTATLDFFGNGLVKAKLSGDALQANIKNSGGIYADGGFVQMATNARASAINISGIVEANQLVERNGVIRLEGGDNAKVEVSGQLIANGNGTTGGSITVTGEQVALMNGAMLDASGDTGGGQVLVGGDYQGKNDTVYNARTTYVASGATIKADAIQQGNGGKVVVWADDLTRYYGNISVQGGALQGNGGFVEVSGKQNLAMNGLINVGAANGIGGTVLFDPENIILNNTAATAPADQAAGTPDVAFADNSGADTQINIGMVQGYSELFLQANNNITVQSPISMTQTNGSIRFDAGNDINVNAAMTAGFLAGNITLNANNNINVNAALVSGFLGKTVLTANADNLNGGDINIGANITGYAGVALKAANITHSAGDIVTAGSPMVGRAGDVTITATGDVNLGNANINAYGTTLTGAGTEGGKVTIQANSLAMTGDINTYGSASNQASASGGTGRDVEITTVGDLSVGNIKTSAGNAGATSAVSRLSGEVKLTSTAGNIKAGNIAANGGSNNFGANVAINAAGKVDVGSVNTSAGSTSTNTTSRLSAGNVDIRGVGDVAVLDINASGANASGANKTGGASGAVNVVSDTGNTSVGAITANAGAGTGTGVTGDSANVFVRAGKDVTQNGDIVTTSTSKDAVVIVAGGNYNNPAPSGYAIKTGNGGRWLIYSTTPVNDVRGGAILTSYNFKQYGTSYGDQILGGDNQNGLIYKVVPGVTATLSGYTVKTYDSTTAVTDVSQLYAYGQGIDGEQIQFSQVTTATFGDKNAGVDKLVTSTVSVVGVSQFNEAGPDPKIYGYPTQAPIQVNGNVGEITKADVTVVTGITANDKVFDNTTAATLNTGSATFVGRLGNDQLTVATATGVFNDSAVGNGKPVLISGISLGGNDAGNYNLLSTTGETTASIFAPEVPPTPVTPTALQNVAPRDDAGLGGLVPNNPALNTMTIVSLNPAAGDEEDLDAVACPVNEDHLGSTPILSSGVKLPDGVNSNCI